MAEEKKDKGLIGKVIDTFSSRDEKEALEAAQKELEAAKKEAAEAKAEAKAAADAKVKAKAAEAEKRAALFAQRQAEAAKAATAQKFIAEHPVQSGETLSHLAQKHYGNASKPYWTLIYEANKDIIGSNPNVIKVGQTLKIPELPANLKK